MHVKIAFIVLLVCSFAIGKNTEIAGDLPKVLSADKSPYLVISDIYVPSGKVVKIEPGTVFLFKNFTGLHVHGMLEARGTSGRQIVFTSVNDHDYNESSVLNTTPYDWNGIYIRKDGIGTELENVTIEHSVKGLISETKFIRLINGIFNDNGRSNLTIEGEEKQVIPGLPVMHNLSIKDAVVDGVPVKILMDPESKKRNVLRYTGLGLFVGGAAMGANFAVEYDKARKDFISLSSKDPGNTIPNTNEQWQSQQVKRDKQRNLMAGGFAVALLGMVSFLFSFTF